MDSNLLWTDDRIYEWVGKVQKYQVLHQDRIKELVSSGELDALAMAIRDEYEARIAKLEADVEFLRSEKQRVIEYASAIEAERDAANARLAELEAANAELQQCSKDWLAMMRAVAEVADTINSHSESPDNEWGLADDATLLEQFDPWQALRDANAELQRRGEWEVVDYLPKTPCSCGNCSNSYRAESETFITLQRGKIRVSVVLPEDIRLMRRKPQQEDSRLVYDGPPVVEMTEERVIAIKYFMGLHAVDEHCITHYDFEKQNYLALRQVLVDMLNELEATGG